MQVRVPSAHDRLTQAIASSRLLAGASVERSSPGPTNALPMHMGLDGVTCVVASADRDLRLFVKAFRTDALRPFTFQGAVEGSRRAGEVGVGPRLLEADAPNEVLFFEALGPGWSTARTNDLRQPSSRRALIEAKMRWHRQPRLGRDLSLRDLARDYAGRLRPRLEAGAAPPLPFRCPMPFEALEAHVGCILDRVAATGVDKAPVHGENVVSNVMIGPGETVLLIDFDRAIDSDPLYDLGACCQDLCQSEDDWAEVSEIQSGRADPAIVARLRLYGLVDDFLWGCWALLAEANPAMMACECFKYASARFYRAAFGLQTLDIAALIRKV